MSIRGEDAVYSPGGAAIDPAFRTTSMVARCKEQHRRDAEKHASRRHSLGCTFCHADGFLSIGTPPLCSPVTRVYHANDFVFMLRHRFDTLGGRSLLQPDHCTRSARPLEIVQARSRWAA